MDKVVNFCISSLFLFFINKYVSELKVSYGPAANCKHKNGGANENKNFVPLSCIFYYCSWLKTFKKDHWDASKWGKWSHHHLSWWMGASCEPPGFQCTMKGLRLIWSIFQSFFLPETQISFGSQDNPSYLTLLFSM